MLLPWSYLGSAGFPGQWLPGCPGDGASEGTPVLGQWSRCVNQAGASSPCDGVRPQFSELTYFLDSSQEKNSVLALQIPGGDSGLLSGMKVGDTGHSRE